MRDLKGSGHSLIVLVSGLGKRVFLHAPHFMLMVKTEKKK